MVVSCQKRFIGLFTFLFFLATPIASFAEVKELTDQELDAVIASNIPDKIFELITNQLGEDGPLQNSLTSISPLLNQILSDYGGLVHLNAINSEVTVQTNLAYVFQAEGVDLNLSNVYQSK